MRNIALGDLETTREVLDLESFQEQLTFFMVGLDLLPNSPWIIDDIIDIQLIAGTVDDRIRNRVPQTADVPLPSAIEERMLRGWGQSEDLLLVRERFDREEVCGERQNIFRAIPQRRNVNAVLAEAVEEVFSEYARFDSFG